jgi:excisionase family DNA binding protein
MTSGSEQKITRAHRDRLALIYVRQSTLAQVREHTESTERQYALAGEAGRLGWERERIVVIDCDLGVSGRTAAARVGFTDLVGRVCMGEVGAIFGLEVSRLARSSADLQRLLELCSLTDTLIIDGDGIYDLRNFNDRLLVGLKGTMSEAELHILAGRLQGAKRAAAERGDLRFPLPVGYVYDEDGETVMDLDEEVCAAVSDLFAAFVQAGSAYGVVAAFQGRRFPKRAYGGAWAGQLRWGRLTHARVLGVLANPAYAGAYAFGRYRSRRVVAPDGTITTKTIELPRAEWPVLILDHHPGYISWETYLANEQRRAANESRHGQRPPRESGALCQGIVQCGSCGRGMSTLHRAEGSYYDCSRSRADHVSTPGCRSVTARVIDGLVARRVQAQLAPEQLALALRAADQVADRRTRATRALELRVERARYESARAERAFDQCDPDNRLVARSLERRWETKLAELEHAEGDLAEHQAAQRPEPSRDTLQTLARDVPALWAAPTTSDKDRKRLLRALIADVTITSDPAGPQLQVGIRWRSGASEQHTTQRPTPSGPARRTPSEAIELIATLGLTHSDQQLVAALTDAGLRTGVGRPFDPAAVAWVRHAHDIPTPPRIVLAADELTVTQVAKRLGVSDGTVYYWISHGQLAADRGPGNRLRVTFSPDIERACRDRVAASVHIPTPTQELAA